jgi:hypothetical protein
MYKREMGRCAADLARKNVQLKEPYGFYSLYLIAGKLLFSTSGYISELCRRQALVVIRL